MITPDVEGVWIDVDDDVDDGQSGQQDRSARQYQQPVDPVDNSAASVDPDARDAVDRADHADQAQGAKAGIELAREALAQAKADALKRGALPGNQSRRSRGAAAAARSRRRAERGGDPRPFGAAIRDLLAERGWERQAAIGGVFGNWAQIVGKDVADHTTPTAFEDGEVVIVADSSTWAQQVRLLAPTLVRRLNEELGDGTVRRVKVRGPASSSGRRGGWRVR